MEIGGTTEEQQLPVGPTPPEVVRDGGRRRRGRADEFTTERHVYEPHRVGLPPLGLYVREVWRRRRFALELARTNLRAQHFDTAFGQAWLILNPVLLALVYFLLVNILRHHSRGLVFFAHLMAGLFAFHFVQQAVNQSAKSVVSGGKLILNTAFPRTLLPLSAVIASFMRFLPTFFVYAPVHVIAGLAIGPHLLWVIPIVALLVVFASGLSMLVAATQVYFRDLASFLPYVMRIWLYVSPVLYYYNEVPRHVKAVLAVNPLTPMLASWSDVLNRGKAPSAALLGVGAAWAVAAFVAGGLFFISREREFAVRL